MKNINWGLIGAIIIGVLFWWMLLGCNNVTKTRTVDRFEFKNCEVVIEAELEVQYE